MFWIKFNLIFKFAQPGNGMKSQFLRLKYHPKNVMKAHILSPEMWSKSMHFELIIEPKM